MSRKVFMASIHIMLEHKEGRQRTNPPRKELYLKHDSANNNWFIFETATSEYIRMLCGYWLPQCNLRQHDFHKPSNQLITLPAATIQKIKMWLHGTEMTYQSNRHKHKVFFVAWNDGFNGATLGVVLDQDTNSSTHPIISSAEVENVFGAVSLPLRCTSIGMSRGDLYSYLTTYSTKPSHELRQMLSLHEITPTCSQNSPFGDAASSYGQDAPMNKHCMYNE